MEETGRRLILELKSHVLQAMQQIGDCNQDEEGASYRVIQDLAGLRLELPAHDGWLTWSLLASLVQDGQVDVIRDGRRLRWRLASSKARRYQTL